MIPRIDGLPAAFTVGLVAGLVFAFFRRGNSTGDGKPFSGR